MEELKKHGIEILKLPNGLEVIFKRIKTTLVHASLLVDCGSVYESKRNNGISHLLEHLIGEDGLIKDRRLRPIYKIDRLGGNTDFEMHQQFTVYHLDTWQNCWRRHLESFIKMIMEPKFSERDVSREKSVIINEILEDTDISEAAILRHLFPCHALSLPEAGSKKTVGAFTAGRIRRWHRKFYAPQRIRLIIVGDISVRGLISVIERAMPIDRREIITPIKEPLLKFGGDEIVLEDQDDHYIYVAFHMPKSAQDLFFFDFIFDIFSDVSSIGLYWEILRPLGIHEGISLEENSHVFCRYALTKFSVSSQKKMRQIKLRFFAWIKKCADRGLPKDLFRRIYKQRVSKIRESIRMGECEWFREYLEDIVTQGLAGAADLFFKPDLLGESATKKEVDRVFRETIGSPCAIFVGLKKRDGGS